MFILEWLRECLAEDVTREDMSMKEPEVQVWQLRNAAPIRLLPVLVRVVPVALIQFIDFVTDLFVVTYFYSHDGLPFYGAYWIGIGGIFLSLLAALYNIIYYAGPCGSEHEACLTTKQIIIACILAPFNLHILVIALVYAIRADEEDERAKRVLNAFLWLKHHESSFEGVPLALITIGAVINEGDMDYKQRMMFYSSIFITLFSISYGIYGHAAFIFKEQIGSRQSQFFACMTVHLVYAMLIIGICFASPFPAVGIFIPCALVLISCGWVALDTFGQRKLYPSEKVLGVIVFFCHVINTLVIDKPFWFGEEGNYPSWNLMIFPIARRALFGAASIAIIAFDPRRDTAYILGILSVMDIFASTRMYRLANFSHSDAFSIICRKQNLDNSVAPIRSFPELGRTSSQNRRRWLAIENGYIYNYDVLEFIISYASHAASLPEKMRQVQSYCCELIEQLDSLTERQHMYIKSVLETYLPSKDANGDEEEHLLYLLRSFKDQPICLPKHVSQYEHPMRAMPLGNALQIPLWTMIPSFFGGEPKHTAYHLSETCDSCDLFISHAWQDGGERKLEMLREYLCIHGLLGLWPVTFVVLSAFLLPVGFAIESQFNRFPGWILSMSLLLVMFLFLLWVFLSAKNIIPSKFAPWSLSRQTVWLDKCCIDQSSPETISAGTHSFKRFLSKCEGMVAFISPVYFTRIWCVYELASFCKIIQSDPQKRLLLFSLEWPNSFNPFKSSNVCEEDLLCYFKDFRCCDASCTKPADKGYVLGEIRNEWGSEEAFEEFVRIKLPSIFAESNHKYRGQLKLVASRSLEQLFGT